MIRSHCPLPPSHRAELPEPGSGRLGWLHSRTVLNPHPPTIVFDECHKAKNASSTKMGKAVLDLQNKLPLARVVYASATGEKAAARGREEA